MLELSEDLKLPADEAVTQKYGFIGRSGSGKSYAAMRLAELFLGADAQIIALDWVGIWWSLRLAADGKRPGFEHVYIFGGEHADVPLEPTSGALMADLVVDKHISVVLDVMHFRKAERTRFATAFAEQFFHRKKTARTACHLFIEEAQAYLPQMVRGEEARMVGVFEDLGKVGRNYGIGNSLISQRPQAINKDVLNQVEVLLAFQTNGPQERKAIAGWTAENTDAGATMMQELPKLHVGESLVWSPQWLRVAKRIHISQRDTYDASSTPTQQAKSIAPKTLAKDDLEQLGVEIAATIEKAKADDPRELRRQIADLTKRLASASEDRNTLAVLNVKEKRIDVLTDADRALLEKVHARVGEVGASLTATVSVDVDGLVDAMLRGIRTFSADYHAEQCAARDEFLRVVDSKSVQKVFAKLAAVAPQSEHPAKRAPQPLPPQGRPEPGRRAVPAVTASRPTSGNPSGNGHDLGRVHRAFLTVLANRQGKMTRRNQLAVFSGYSVKSRHVDNTISALRTSGYIAGSSDALVITDTGLTALGTWDELPTGRPLIDYWIREAGTAPGAMLRALVEVYPRTLSRDEVAEASNYSPTSRHVDNSLSYLRTLELIEGDRSRLSASTELFS